MKPDELPKKISIDITGVKKLEISVTQDRKGDIIWTGDSYYGFGNIIVK